MHGHYSKIPYTYMPPRFITYADGRWDMAPASIHHAHGWAMTSDREIVDYLKMCLAPTHAGRTGILGLGVEPWKYAPDLQRVMAFLRKVDGDEPGRGDLLTNQAIVELQVELNDPAVQKELRLAVTTAINELPAAHRMVLMLRDVEGLSTLETAELLGLNVPAVKTRVHRARLFLRKQLGDAMTTLSTGV